MDENLTTSGDRGPEAAIGRNTGEKSTAAMGTADQGRADLSPTQAALAAVTLEVARHVGTEPLAGPRAFALLPTGALLRSQPAFASLLDEATRIAAQDDEHHLTPLELTEPEPSGDDDPLDALGRTEWPDIAAGGAWVADLPEHAWQTSSAGTAQQHSGDGTVRVVVTALTAGTTWSAVRLPGRRDLMLGARLVPQLTEALLQSLGSPAATVTHTDGAHGPAGSGQGAFPGANPR